MKKKMKKKSFSFVLVLFLMTALLPMTPSAQATSGQTGNKIVEVRETVTRESTVYAGEIFVDGQSAMKYLYSTDLSNHSQVFKNLQDALAGTAFDGLVPTITGESETRGLAVSSAHAENMNADWTSAAAVAKLFYTGTPGAETNGNLYDLNAAYRGYIDSRYQVITEHYNTPHSFDKRLDSALSTTIDFVWVNDDGVQEREYTVTVSIELTTVFYTSVNVTTAPTNYTVTYKVVNGTWSDGSTADRTETVTSGASPASVPTGMKASSGYTGGAWDTAPANAAIAGATTFTYTFTAKQAASVTKVPTAKTLTYNGEAQELVTAGTATGGTMQYALGTVTEATQSYTASIPTGTNAGTYYVWYKVIGDANHLDYIALQPIAVTIAAGGETEARMEQRPLDSVPAELAHLYGSVEEIRRDMMLKVSINGEPVKAENTFLYDVALLVSFDGGRTWQPATEENFPAEGIQVTLPYPAGTNGNDYDFAVSHMFTVTSRRLGTIAGGIEVPAVTKTAEGLRVLFRGLSPVLVSWARKGEKPEPSPTVTIEPTATPAPTAMPGPVPKTGDPGRPGLWLGLILLGIIGFVVRFGRKASGKRN